MPSAGHASCVGCPEMQAAAGEMPGAGMCMVKSALDTLTSYRLSERHLHVLGRVILYNRLRQNES